MSTWNANKVETNKNGKMRGFIYSLLYANLQPKSSDSSCVMSCLSSLLGSNKFQFTTNVDVSSSRFCGSFFFFNVPCLEVMIRRFYWLDNGRDKFISKRDKR